MSVNTQIERVAILITSHNYGEYVAEAIQSAQFQTYHCCKILVIDDASDASDRTQEICRSMGVEYRRVEHHNCYSSRQTGLFATESEYVVFLDADDMLLSMHVEEALKLFDTDTSIGIVTTDLRLFGDRSMLVCHQPRNIEQVNWIHAGSVVRRTALEMSEAYDKAPCPLSAHEDWYTWRYVMREGWKAVKSAYCTYMYRQHSASMMAGGMRTKPYYVTAAMALQPITLVLPICRSKYLNRLFAWVQGRLEDGVFNELLIIDSANDSVTRREICEQLSDVYVETLIHVKRPFSKGLADMHRDRREDVGKAVQQQMTRIYKHLRKVTNEYMFIVEDDVLPPVDAVTKLTQEMGINVAGVSAIVPSRFQRAYAIAGHQIGQQIPLERQEGVDNIAFSGFGCLLLRKSAMLEAAPFNTLRSGNYDIEFWRDIVNKGWELKLNYSVRCEHGEYGC